MFEIASMQDLILCIQYYRQEAERKRNVLRAGSAQFGKALSPADIDRAGHEDDKMADALAITMGAMARKVVEGGVLGNKMGPNPPVQMTIVHNEITREEAVKPVAATPVKPKIEDVVIKKQAEEIIADVEVEDSIFEAVRAGHMDVAKSKLEHFYRGTELLSNNATERDKEVAIREIVRRSSERRTKELEDTIGTVRSVASPFETPEKITRIGLAKSNKFNIDILLGEAKANNPKINEDRVKLAAIQMFSKGEKRMAVQLLRTFYANKNWSEQMAEEFLNLLMKKDPYKELNISIAGILKFNKEKGDAKRGIKLCRSILCTYFDKKYTVPSGATALTPEQKTANDLIDRFINRQLKEIEA